MVFVVSTVCVVHPHVVDAGISGFIFSLIHPLSPLFSKEASWLRPSNNRPLSRFSSPTLLSSPFVKKIFKRLSRMGMFC